MSAGTIDASDQSANAMLLESPDALAGLPLGLQQFLECKALLPMLELQIGEP